MTHHLPISLQYDSRPLVNSFGTFEVASHLSSFFLRTTHSLLLLLLRLRLRLLLLLLLNFKFFLWYYLSFSPGAPAPPTYSTSLTISRPSFSLFLLHTMHYWFFFLKHFCKGGIWYEFEWLHFSPFSLSLSLSLSLVLALVLVFSDVCGCTFICACACACACACCFFFFFFFSFSEWVIIFYLWYYASNRYSTLEKGWCGDGTSPAPEGCTWQVAEVVKIVNKTCSDNAIFNTVESYDATHGTNCFKQDECMVGAARNTSSVRLSALFLQFAFSLVFSRCPLCLSVFNDLLCCCNRQSCFFVCICTWSCICILACLSL